MSRYNSKGPKQAMSSYLTTLKDDVKKVIMEQHAAALREYANKALVQEIPLSPEEDKDREVRMREYLTIGRSYTLTDRMLVAHIFKGLKDIQKSCECPTCREF